MRNIIDTNRLYMDIYKKTTSISLKNLAFQELAYEMKKDYQKADWRIRPLFKEMIDYAAIDAEILPYLYIKLMTKISK